MTRFLKTLAELGRISNLPTVWTNLLAGWILGGGWAAGGGFDLRFLWLCLGGSLVYFGGMALNDAADADWDREHGKDRPIPRGDISRGKVWILSGATLLVGAAVMAIMGGASILWVALLVASVVIYDFFHKPWAGSVIFMAGCRVFLFLSAVSAVGDEISQFSLLRALALGLYIVGLTLLARAEDGGDRRWATFGTFLLATPFVLAIHQITTNSPSSLFIPVAMVALSLIWLLPAVFQKTMPIPKRVGRLLAGIVLVDALAVVTTEPYVALCLAACAPLLLLWQKWVSAS